MQIAKVRGNKEDRQRAVAFKIICCSNDNLGEEPLNIIAKDKDWQQIRDRGNHRLRPALVGGNKAGCVLRFVVLQMEFQDGLSMQQPMAHIKTEVSNNDTHQKPEKVGP